MLNAVAGSPSPTLDFYGHPFSHPLDECYFSQCPVRFGDYVAKIGAFPVAAEQRALDDWRLDPHQDEDGFRHAAIDYFAENDALFELRAQVWTNADTQPIEDSSVDWPTQDSEYRTIATIRLPRQAAYGAERVRYFDEVMTFRPAHSLAGPLAPHYDIGILLAGDGRHSKLLLARCFRPIPDRAPSRRVSPGARFFYSESCRLDTAARGWGLDGQRSCPSRCRSPLGILIPELRGLGQCDLDNRRAARGKLVWLGPRLSGSGRYDGRPQ